ncbi:MAG: hypothetical protein ACOZNI_17365 [Myxococcota bacterium]
MEATLREVEAQVRAANTRGDAAAEGDARVRVAGVLTAMGRLADAIAELEKAGPLFVKAGQPAEHAGATWALALLVTRDPKRKGEARDLLLKVRALATLGGRPDLEAKALFRLAMVEADAQDLDAALAWLATLLEKAPDVRTRIEAHRARAGFFQALGRPNRALSELEAALSLARDAGDARTALQLRLEKRVLQPFTADLGTWESFAVLLEDARAAGDPVLEGAIELQRAGVALRGDRPEEGEQAAQAARAAALASGDVVLYTLACMLIAEARELAGDRSGVLAILLTCKATLEQRFGKEAGRPVVWVLQATEARWGKEATDAALAEYRRMAASRMPQA